MKLANNYLRRRDLEGRAAGLVVIVAMALIAATAVAGAAPAFLALPVICGLVAYGFIAARHSIDERTRRIADAEVLLNTAIESTPNGLCIFDAGLKVVISNKNFAGMYGMAPDQIRPGTPLREILQCRSASSYCPTHSDQYVADCIAKASCRETVETIDELRNGYVYGVSRHPMLDGGLIEVHRDITDARQAEARAEAARQELVEKQYAIDQAVIVAVTDVRGAITYANDNFCTISGYSREELLGQNHRILNSGVHSRAFFGEMYRCLARGEVWRGELCNKAKSGSLYWVDTIITPQLGPDGKPISYMAIRIDITARKKAEAQIAYAAAHDALTGLANRTAFLAKLNEALIRSQEQSRPLTVYMLDLDGFKNVNDTLGHAAGDTLLKEMAGRLRALLCDGDLMARLGGDEFAIIQTDFGDQREEAIELAVRMLETVAKPFHVEGQEVSIGISIGIALAPSNGASAAELLKKADLALYRVKAEGRNNFSFFEEELSERAITRLKMVNDMRVGITRGEFELHYQPLFDARTSRLSGMEALIRWRHPAGGLLPPDRFIGVAEEAGLMDGLGQWILHRACSDAALWPDDVKVAVNLSAVQFRTGTLLDVILCALVESGLPPSRLELEITESLLLQNKETNVFAIQQLKNIGVTIALDDFGTGYASLSSLLSFPFDKIKIDKSFTEGLLTRTDSRAVVASVLTLARGLEIEVTVEGVETGSEFEFLRAQGVSHVQGYLFGRPRPLAELDFAALRSIASKAA